MTGSYSSISEADNCVGIYCLQSLSACGGTVTSATSDSQESTWFPCVQFHSRLSCGAFTHHPSWQVSGLFHRFGCLRLKLPSSSRDPSPRRGPEQGRMHLLWGWLKERRTKAQRKGDSKSGSRPLKGTSFMAAAKAAQCGGDTTPASPEVHSVIGAADGTLTALPSKLNLQPSVHFLSDVAAFPNFLFCFTSVRFCV